MHRRLILVGVLAIALVGCGGSSSSASPSASGAGSSAASPSTSASRSAGPAASTGASVEPSASAAASGSTATAVCDGITLRKQPAASGAKVKVINSGTAVHVVATVSGTAYTAGSCGNSGSDWFKIDKVGGKTAKAAYGVQYVYAAAGFFQ
jgi:hypothetical protein